MLWLIAAGILAVVPWLFGGNGPEGYWWIVWSGRLVVAPICLWLVAAFLRREPPSAAFWAPVICWSLLAAQVIASSYNPSSVPVAPWEGHGFTAVPYNPDWPSTAFKQATEVESPFWLALGLLAIAARNVGCTPRQVRGLLWILVVTAATLAIIGVPFKFSGQHLILGRWEAPEGYFYATFLYHNHWCAFALLGVAAAAALFESCKNLAARCCLAILGGVIAASAPVSVSRLGTLAMVVFGAVVIVMSCRKRRPAARRSFALPVVAASILCGVLLIAAGTTYEFRVHDGHYGDRTWGKLLHANPFDLRAQIAADTLTMIKDKPWFGWGLGGFGGAFRFYQRASTRIVANEGRVTLYDHPHNDWLEKFAEFGLVGFTLLVTPVIFWIKRAIDQGPRSGQDKWILIGCVGLLIFAIGDSVFVNRCVAACFALLFPLALRRPARWRLKKGIPEISS
jgi:O-antigen ligase